MNESSKLEIIKSLEKYIYFDWVLNILSLLFDIKKVSRIENLNSIDTVIEVLSKFWFSCHNKKDKTLYVAKNKENLDLWVYNDIEKNNAYNLWKLLWFPDCCIKKFIDIWWVSEKKLFNFLKEINNKDISSNYLNFFENKLIYHLPCSMTCKKSINIWKKVYKIFTLLTTKNDTLDFFRKKTYIVFKNLQWLKIENNNYSFWWLLKEKNTRIKNKIKKWYEIRIISDNEIILYNWKKDEILVDDVIIFNFI